MLCKSHEGITGLDYSQNSLEWGFIEFVGGFRCRMGKKRANCGFDEQVSSNGISEEVLQFGGNFYICSNILVNVLM